MAEPFLAEIRMISFNFPPKGWAFCNGQILPINQNQALFSIMGTTYGGNGQTTFALPNLQGRIPLHVGSGFNLGQVGGEQAHTLNISEMPAHTHPVSASGGVATLNSGSNAFMAASSSNPYGAAPDATLNPSSIAPVGGSQPHLNMPPTLTINFIVALQGIFPSRN